MESFYVMREEMKHIGTEVHVPVKFERPGQSAVILRLEIGAEPALPAQLTATVKSATSFYARIVGEEGNKVAEYYVRRVAQTVYTYTSRYWVRHPSDSYTFYGHHLEFVAAVISHQKLPLAQERWRLYAHFLSRLDQHIAAALQQPPPVPPEASLPPPSEGPPPESGNPYNPYAP